MSEKESTTMTLNDLEKLADSLPEKAPKKESPAKIVDGNLVVTIPVDMLSTPIGRTQSGNVRMYKRNMHYTLNGLEHTILFDDIVKVAK
jgi:hypothetical protein